MRALLHATDAETAAAAVEADAVVVDPATLDRLPAEVQVPLLLAVEDVEALDVAILVRALARVGEIVLRRARGPTDLDLLSARLAVAEARAARADGSTRIVAWIETAEGALALPAMAAGQPRLSALAFDGAGVAASAGSDLAAAHARATLLLAAAAASVEAIDVLRADELPALRRAAEAARRDGFAAAVAPMLEGLAALAEI